MPSIFTGSTNAVTPAPYENSLNQPTTAKPEDEQQGLPDPLGKAALLETSSQGQPAEPASPTTEAGTPAIHSYIPSPAPSSASANSNIPEVQPQPQQHQTQSPPTIHVESNENDESDTGSHSAQPEPVPPSEEAEEPSSQSLQAATQQRAKPIQTVNPENQCVRVQLIPFAEPPNRIVTGHEMMERRMKEGATVRIGRMVVKDGQPQMPKPGKGSDNDIWYTSKVVSRTHAEMWVKEGQIYIKDIGSSSGTFLNKMRLSPSGKESRPYPIKENDVIQFGVDYKGKTEDIFKCITVKVGFYDQSWVKQSRKNANPVRFRAALKALLAASNPYGSSSGQPAAKDVDEDDPTATECCICIGSVAPFQAIFLAPCSHCFHFKCVSSLIAQSAMFQCPLCRQVANLAASVSTDSLNEDENEEQESDGEGPSRGNDGDEEHSDFESAGEAGHDRHRTERLDGSLDVEEHGDGHHTAKPSVVMRREDAVQACGEEGGERARQEKDRLSWHGEMASSSKASPADDSTHESPLLNPASPARHSVGGHDRQKSSATNSSATKWSKKGKGKDEPSEASSDSVGSPSASKGGRRASLTSKIGDIFKKKHAKDVPKKEGVHSGQGLNAVGEGGSCANQNSGGEDS
ncbi:hypothetical protein HDU67_005272 [Dinochytrium kinnereticum]|nr:hypothetical protein HDU67_005272 [Dinochytrium kinnereticum]